MKHLSILFINIILAFCIQNMYGSSNQAMADSIASTLSAVKTPEDSIRILFDVFDLADQKNKATIGENILEVAVRANNAPVIADMIRQLSVLKIRDSKRLHEFLELANRLLDGSERRAVDLFVKVELATNEATYSSEEDRMKYLLKYVKEDITPKGDMYDDLINLYRVAIFLGRSAKGSMYMEYLANLEKKIEELPDDHYYVRNVFYTTAANFYTQNGNHKKGLEFDRLLLKQIEKLEDIYAKRGRKYRNYDRFYYICYRRMLRNYKALPLSEVKDLYARCALLAERDDEVRSDFFNTGRPTAYRMLAEKDYSGAISYLKKALTLAKDDNLRRELLGSLVEAADSVNDTATLSDALLEYNHMLEERQRLQSEVSYRELQIRYDVNNLKAEKATLEKDKINLEMATNQKVISITLCALFLLAIIVMWLYRSNFKLRQKLHQIKTENKALQNNIENLLDDGIPHGTQDIKSEFYSK